MELPVSCSTHSMYLFIVVISKTPRLRVYPVPLTAREDTRICTPEAVQIKAPRLTIYPVTAQEVSTREHEQWASWGICRVC